MPLYIPINSQAVHSGASFLSERKSLLVLKIKISIIKNDLAGMPGRYPFLSPRRESPCSLCHCGASLVGAGGFEPPTSRTRTVRSNRAEPRPDGLWLEAAPL
jgi:hypothetical protein